MILFSCICIFADNRHNKSIRFSYEVEGHSGYDMRLVVLICQFDCQFFNLSYYLRRSPCLMLLSTNPRSTGRASNLAKDKYMSCFIQDKVPSFLKSNWVCDRQTKPNLVRGTLAVSMFTAHWSLIRAVRRAARGREKYDAIWLIGNMHKLHKVNFEGTCSRSPCHWIHSRPHQLRRLDRKQLRQPGIQFVSCTYCHWVVWVMVLIRSLHLDHKSLPTWIWKWYLCDIPSYFWTTSRYKLQYMQYYITPNRNCIGSRRILSRYIWYIGTLVQGATWYELHWQ